MTEGGQPKRGKRKAAFKEIKPHLRKNPQRIRRLLFDTIKEDFDSSLDKAAEVLKSGVPLDENRKYHNKFTRDTLSRLTRDETELRYAHLELLSRHYGIPTGLLLLFTRLQTEVGNRGAGGATSALRAIDSIDAALRVMRESLEQRGRTRGAALNRSVLKRAAEAYKSGPPEQQVQLPMQIPKVRPKG